MRNIFLPALAAFLLIPAIANAQAAQETAAPQYNLGARASANLDWKIAKGLHLEVGEELRYRSVVETPFSFNTSLGLTYKCFPFLKIGADAIMVNQKVNKEGQPAWRPKYKFGGSVMGIFESGLWTFSLKEKFQAVWKNYEVNLSRQPQTTYYLKSRLKASYQVPGKPVEPYASVELKHKLNAVNWSTLYSDAVFKYDECYLSRVRLNLGTEWRISKSNILDFYLLADYNYDRKIKTKSSGAFKKVVHTPSFAFTFGVAYTFGL